MSLFDPSTVMIYPAWGGWGESGKDGSHPWNQLLRRLPFFSLPPRQCTRIDAQVTGQLLLSEAHVAGTRNYAFANPVRLEYHDV